MSRAQALLKDSSHCERGGLKHGLLGRAGIGCHCAQIALFVILCFHLGYGFASGLAQSLHAPIISASLRMTFETNVSMSVRGAQSSAQA